MHAHPDRRPAPAQGCRQPQRRRAPARTGEAPQAEPLPGVRNRLGGGDPPARTRGMAAQEPPGPRRVQRARGEGRRVQRRRALVLMAQFDVYRNANPATRARIPYLLDVQSDLLDILATRVVIPLCKPGILKGRLAERLNPVFEVEGREVAMLTPE